MPLDLSHYYVQNAGHEWSFKEAAGTMRFEVRPDDHLAGDGAVKNRSEVGMAAKLVPGHRYRISYSLMVEPGPKNTAGWLVLNQIQSSFDQGEPGHSPPFALELNGERMRIASRSSTPHISSPADTVYVTHYTDKTDITRGHWYQMVIDVTFDPFGKGALTVTRDGTKLVDYHGPIGFNDAVGPYWKQGLYRETATTIMAADYKDLVIAEQ